MRSRADAIGRNTNATNKTTIEGKGRGWFGDLNCNLQSSPLQPFISKGIKMKEKKELEEEEEKEEERQKVVAHF